MAVKTSIATGNFTSAGTWAVVDATSYLNFENGSEVLTTTFSGTRSQTFSPGAITISHIAVKLSVRTGTTGTITVGLYNATLLSDVTATEVTINCADLPAAVTADLNGGWIPFKLASPVTLLVANNYAVQARTSSSAQISLFRDGTADNLARCLVTTTTSAPVAGDDLIVSGEYTGVGTSNSFTVTNNQTATTDYGSGSTSLVTPALSICSKGTLTWGTSSATGYNLKLSGNLIIYAGGAMNMGTVSTPCPRDSTQKLQFDCVANVDFGMTVRSLSSLTMQGLSRSSGLSIYKCKLTSDASVNSTTLSIDEDTGWLDNDEIVVTSTTQTIAQSERGTLNGSGSPGVLNIDGFAGAGGGLAFAHSGTNPTLAEVVNLTRNVSIFGVSPTIQTYIDIKASAIVNIDWAEFYWMGSAVALKGGIQTVTTTGSFDIRHSSFHDFSVTGSDAIAVSGGNSNNIFIQDCVFYNINSNHFLIATTTGTWTVDNCIFILNVAGVNMVVLSDLGGTFSNITAVSGAANYCIVMSDPNVSTGTFSSITCHSNTQGLHISAGNGITINNLVSWRNGLAGIAFSTITYNTTINLASLFGNGTANIYVVASGSVLDLKINYLTCSGDSSFPTPFGIGGGSAPWSISGSIDNSTFGISSGIRVAHSTADISVVANSCQQLVFNSSVLASTAEINNQSLMNPCSIVASQKHDQTNGLHKTYKTTGTLTIDTTSGLFEVTPSLRMTPLSSSIKLSSTGRWSVFSAATSDGEPLTVSVKVRESVVGDGTDYNGNRVRLIVKKNASANITEDTVIATATASSEGSFEVITGSTPAPTEDAILDFEVDCDGTTGWVNIDSWAVSSAADTKGMNYWQDGQPVAYGDNSSGGGSPSYYISSL